MSFISCHDGFTLRDLVSYERKHNEANGESNNDGTDDNRSWNWGVEGPTDDAAVLELRARQSRGPPPRSAAGRVCGCVAGGGGEGAPTPRKKHRLRPEQRTPRAGWKDDQKGL